MYNILSSLERIESRLDPQYRALSDDCQSKYNSLKAEHTALKKDFEDILAVYMPLKEGKFKEKYEQLKFEHVELQQRFEAILAVYLPLKEGEFQEKYEKLKFEHDELQERFDKMRASYEPLKRLISKESTKN